MPSSLNQGLVGSRPHDRDDDEDAILYEAPKAKRPRLTEDLTEDIVDHWQPRVPEDGGNGGIAPAGKGEDDEINAYGGANEDDGHASDADSDYLEVQADVAKLDADRQKFLAEHTGIAPQKQEVRRRGPRKEAELTPLLKKRLGVANEYFVSGRYQEAIDAIGVVMKMNGEVYQAWAMLASIYDDTDYEYHSTQNATRCKMLAACLRPNDVSGFLATAEYALEHSTLDVPEDNQDQDLTTDEQEQAHRYEQLHLAKKCYSGALRADRNNIAARLGKANICLELGQAASAASEYKRALRRKPLDLAIVRSLAEASFDSIHQTDNAEAAIAAYKKVIDHCQKGKTLENDVTVTWIDATIYAALFAALDDYKGAIKAISGMARWLLGRREQSYWDSHDRDDREWDRKHDRRIEVKGFVRDQHPIDAYGLGLPLELRAMLAVYRLKLGDEEEGLSHLSWIQSRDAATTATLQVAPNVISDVAGELYKIGMVEIALQNYQLYAELLRQSDDVDAEALVQQGRCHRDLGEYSAAEDCFLAAIDADEDNIDARYELAQAYEKANERESAFIMVNEALSLEKARQKIEEAVGPNGESKETRFIESNGKLVEKTRRPLKRAVPGAKLPVRRTKKTPRVRRLADPVKRQEFESEMSKRLKAKYQLCQTLKTRVQSGDEEAIEEWMDAAKELTDDFRSFRDFYTWDSYVKFLGYGSLIQTAAEGQGNGSYHDGMTAMAKRLHEGLAPEQGGEGNDGTPEVHRLARKEYRGIPFSEWLDLFLEYALGLARARKAQEAYRVCQSIRDSIVWKARDNMFLIHLTWASCAIQVGDEETCVAVARYFMRDVPFASDGYRMYAALCRVCQSPSSWYSSGPAQKFILRQIKIVDECVLHPDSTQTLRADGISIPTENRPKELDLCLLVVYGHILFASNSFGYALNYFQRAHAIDPNNLTVTLSIALCYCHWGLKRQAENRQYMIMQGLTYMLKYYEDRLKSEDSVDRQEGHYNMARTYQLLGLHDLTIEYYNKVLEEVEKSEEEAAVAGKKKCIVDRRDFVTDTAFNLRTLYLVVGNSEAALNITRRWLVL